MALEQYVIAHSALLLDIPEEKAAEPREGRTWSRKEELGHLIDSALNNHNRIVRAALDGSYTGPGYDADGWVDMNGYAELGWVVIVNLWRDMNLQLARVLARIPQEWLQSPCSIAGDIGHSAPVTLEFLIADYHVHLDHHMKQILA